MGTPVTTESLQSAKLAQDMEDIIVLIWRLEREWNAS